MIQRCVESDPRLRPASALQVAAALPGGDPLAVALAAGETPSPEMVAASGSSDGLRSGAAWALLALTIAASVIAIVAGQRAILFRRVTIERSPSAMADRAREFLTSVGYGAAGGDTAYAVWPNFAYSRVHGRQPELSMDAGATEEILHFWCCALASWRC